MSTGTEPTDRADHTDPADAGAPLSERLHEIAEAKVVTWPEDDYVPHEKLRERNAVADAIGHGALMQGGAGRI